MRISDWSSDVCSSDLRRCSVQCNVGYRVERRQRRIAMQVRNDRHQQVESGRNETRKALYGNRFAKLEAAVRTPEEEVWRNQHDLATAKFQGRDSREDEQK